MALINVSFKFLKELQSSKQDKLERVPALSSMSKSTIFLILCSSLNNAPTSAAKFWSAISFRGIPVPFRSDQSLSWEQHTASP